MSRGISPSVMVGNDFVLSQPRLRAVPPAPIIKATSVVPVFSAPAQAEIVDVRLESASIAKESIFRHVFELMHRYSLGVFALLFLLVAVSGIKVAAIYWTARVAPAIVTTSSQRYSSKPLRGLNMMVPSSELTETVQSLTAQPISLTIGTKSVPFAPETINSWLKTVVDSKNKVAYIHVDDRAVTASLKSATEPYAYGARDQVTITRDDGTSRVVVAGRNGTSLSDTSKLSSQISSSLINAKGMQLIVPLQSVPFQALTQANFDKLIEVDVVTKRMYAYSNGKLERTFLISAGAPETPTPLGQYKIRSKPARQDMRGYNTNGTKYFQPNVQWINYFAADVAIHGNYWRPTSWFGNINSSHGCVSLPNSEAKWVYDWAPIGTTVITHN